MRVKRISLSEAMAPIGDAARAVGALGLTVETAWDVAVLLRDEYQPLASSAFFKSVSKNVDSVDKKRNYATMVTTLFDSARESNYQDAIKDTLVQCKSAHSFIYAGSKVHVWELKLGSKDRIYFYQLNRQAGLAKGVIVLCLAFHKRDQRTPTEVSSKCESDIRQLLSEQTVRFC